ncbi:MAG: hypothetical protein AAFZ09_13425, partial [Pseudomonadota bacterium]
VLLEDSFRQLRKGDAATLRQDTPAMRRIRGRHQATGATTATITFDLIGVDDLSGAPATVFVNGQAVAIYADNHGNITTSSPDVAGVSVEINQHYNNSPMGAGGHGHDSRATYTITVQDPGDSVTFGVGSNSTQPTSDEFYAIDDVDISAG